jgi:predicted GNAT family acetyltransferase
MTAPELPPIRDNAKAHRFEIVVDHHAAVATYEMHGDTIKFIHTVVPEALRGRGVATRLTEFALASARERGLKVNPQCVFFSVYMGKHPQTHDLLSPEGRTLLGIK